MAVGLPHCLFFSPGDFHLTVLGQESYEESEGNAEVKVQTVAEAIGPNHPHSSVAWWIQSFCL